MKGDNTIEYETTRAFTSAPIVRAVLCNRCALALPPALLPTDKLVLGTTIACTLSSHAFTHSRNRDNEQHLPGIILSPSASSEGAIAGMKRAHDAGNAPTYGEPHPKKRQVVRALHHTQPIQHIAEPISAELDPFGESKDFFDQQLRRAIAIQCKGVGFESARPDALEEFRALVDSCMASPCDRNWP